MSEKQPFSKHIFVRTIAGITIVILLLLASRLGIIANSDSFWGIHAGSYLHSSIYAWYDFLFGGTDGSSPLLFGYAIAAALNSIHLSFADAGVVLLVMCGIWYTTYNIATLFIPPQTKSQKHLIAASTAFVIANELVRAFLNTNITILWGTLFMHLSIYWYLRAIMQKSQKLLVLSVISLNCSFIDFHSAVITGIFIGAYSTLSIVGKVLQRRWHSAVQLVYSFLIFGTLATLLNMYWLLAIIYNELHHVGLLSGYSSNTAITRGVLEIYNNYNNLAYNIMLSTNNVIRSTWMDIVDVIITYIIVAIVICSLFLMKRSKDAQLLYLVVLTFFFLSLAFGPLSPLGVFDFFWQNTPGFTLFRNFFKFQRLLLLIYSILLAFAVIRLTSKSMTKIVLMCICIVMIMKSSLYVIHAPAFKPFKVPDYYADFQNSLKHDPEDTHIAVLPIMSSHLWFDWPDGANYDIQDPVRYYPTKPIILNVATPQEALSDFLNKQMALSLADTKNHDLFFTIAGMQNIRYFLIRDDLSKAFLQSRIPSLPISKEVLDVKRLKRNADIDTRIQKINTYGALHLYKIKDAYALAHIYIPVRSVLSEDDIGAFVSQSFSQLSILAKEPRNSVVFYTQQNADRTILLSQIEKESTQAATPALLEYKKINPIKYRIRIHDAKGRFPLVFSESFHQNWLLYQTPFPSHFKDDVGKYQSPIISNTIQNDNLPDGQAYETWYTSLQKNNVREMARATHSIANISTNAWIIDTDAFCTPSAYCQKRPDGTYNMELIIEYFPQRIHMLGLVVSATTFLGCLIILIIKPLSRFFSQIP